MANLEVRLADGKPAVIVLPSNADGSTELAHFIARSGRFANVEWVALNGGSEYVRYDQIVAVKLTP